MSWLNRLFGKSGDATPPPRHGENPKPAMKPARDAELQERYRHLLRPAIHLRPASKPGFSRLGGLPQMPADLPWPEWNTIPQMFLAQIDLAEIARVLPSFLPSAGSLFFFYDQEQSMWGFDPKDRGGWRALYHPDDCTSLPERPAPARLPKDLIYRAQPISPHRIELLPDSQCLPGSSFDWDRDGEAYLELRSNAFEGFKCHQMLGYPTPVQGDGMELECQLASNDIYVGNPKGYKHPRVPELRSGAEDWKLLLQLDSDDHVGWMWGDVGTLYFWVRESDARRAHFSNVWMVFQCC